MYVDGKGGEGGMQPGMQDRRFVTYSTVRFVSNPIDAGMFPSNRLFDKNSSLQLGGFSRQATNAGCSAIWMPATLGV